MTVTTLTIELDMCLLFNICIMNIGIYSIV